MVLIIMTTITPTMTTIMIMRDTITAPRTCTAPIAITTTITITTATTTAIIITATTATITTTITRPMPAPNAEPSGAGDLPLLLWVSPAFPVGSYAYSHGLEWAVEAVDITDAATLFAWLDDLLHLGAPRSDGVLFACAFRATRDADWRALGEINELAVALCGSNERRLEATAQGGAFLTAMRAAWPCPAFDHWPTSERETVAYCIAVAFAAAGHGLSPEASLQAFLLAVSANLVSAGIRLGAIGQTDGQRILARLTPRVAAQALALADATLNDLGSCAIRSDIAAMKHETQYSRLFRS
jgi:urease accessory protein